MRQSHRDRVRGISETRVKHPGMRGVKRRNRVEDGERRGGERMGRDRGDVGGESGKMCDRQAARGGSPQCESTFKLV